MQRDIEEPAALARLLRELPDDAARPYDFSEFQRRARERAWARRDRAGPRTLAALAAIAVGVVAVSLRFDERPQRTLRPQDAAPEAVAASSDAAITAQGSVNLPSAARIEMLERWLATLPDEPALVRVGTRAAVTGLEDRLAEVDDLLTAERIDEARPAQLLALQQERRRLVSSLAQVRYAETLADASR
jgi:hypothetical protein